MTSTPSPVDIRNAWEVAEVAHLSTGQTIAPDEQTGDEWTVERRNEHLPFARVVTTYAVVRTPFDADGNRVDWPIDEDDPDVVWRYAVEDQTEGLVSTVAGDEFWSGEVDTLFTERGEGSFRDYETEEEADQCAASMAQHDASLSGGVTWNGEPA